VVPDHHDHHHCSSYSIDTVCPVDHQMGSGRRDCRHRLGGFDRDSRNSFCCPEIRGKAKRRGEISTKLVGG